MPRYNGLRRHRLGDILQGDVVVGHVRRNTGRRTRAKGLVHQGFGQQGTGGHRQGASEQVHAVKDSAGPVEPARDCEQPLPERRCTAGSGRPAQRRAACRQPLAPGRSVYPGSSHQLPFSLRGTALAPLRFPGEANGLPGRVQRSVAVDDPRSAGKANGLPRRGHPCKSLPWIELGRDCVSDRVWTGLHSARPACKMHDGRQGSAPPGAVSFLTCRTLAG